MVSPSLCIWVFIFSPYRIQTRKLFSEKSSRYSNYAQYEQFFMITILFCVPLHCPHGLKGTLAWAILISFILHFGILHFWYQVFSLKKEWASQWFCWMDELSWSLAALIKPPLLTTSQVYKPFKTYKPYKLTSPRHVRLLFNIITVYHYTCFKR